MSDDETGLLQLVRGWASRPRNPGADAPRPARNADQRGWPGRVLRAGMLDRGDAAAELTSWRAGVRAGRQRRLAGSHAALGHLLGWPKCLVQDEGAVRLSRALALAGHADRVCQNQARRSFLRGWPGLRAWDRFGSPGPQRPPPGRPDHVARLTRMPAPAGGIMIARTGARGLTIHAPATQARRPRYPRTAVPRQQPASPCRRRTRVASSSARCARAPQLSCGWKSTR